MTKKAAVLSQNIQTKKIIRLDLVKAALAKKENTRFGKRDYRLVKSKNKVPRSGAALWICRRK